MASICNDPNGRRRILFLNARGERKTTRLGKAQRRFAESVKIKIEDLVNASIAGHAPRMKQATGWRIWKMIFTRSCRVWALSNTVIQQR